MISEVSRATLQLERSVIGGLMRNRGAATRLISDGLDSDAFIAIENALLFDAIVEAHYADEPSDPLTLAARFERQLAMAWPDVNVIEALQGLVEKAPDDEKLAKHAKLVTQASNGRRLVGMAAEIMERVDAGDDPAEIAGSVSESALRLVTGNDPRISEWLSPEQSGRLYIQELRRQRAAIAAGHELGAFFGIPAFDEFTHGLQPTELLILAGEPGVGKSAVGWRAAMNFAGRQLKNPEDQRTAAGIFSIEMGHAPSNQRLTQAITAIPGSQLRRGRISDAEEQLIVQKWREEMVGRPLYFNYAPKMKCSQLRALVTEGIRRHNIGLVVIDHFRMFDLDKRLPNKNDEDEEKARFLKEDLAGELNVAVICLAHTRKKDAQFGDPRPKLSDLRGSGQIAAHSDFTCFIHRPFKYASEDDISSGDVQETDAELIWEKNRHGHDGSQKFYFDPSTMTVL